MMPLIYMLLLILGSPQLPNSIAIGTPATATTPSTICQEPGCVITAISAPATLQLGTGDSWCPAPIVSPKLPLVVSWPNNPGLCLLDPAPGVVKQLVALQQAQSYTITYTIDEVLQPVFTVPALPPPAPTVVSTLDCNGPVKVVLYSDGHFEVTASAITCK